MKGRWSVLYVFLILLVALFLLGELLPQGPAGLVILNPGEEVRVTRHIISDNQEIGNDLQVVLEVSVGESVKAVGIEESAPTGWAFSNCPAGVDCKVSSNKLELLLFNELGLTDQNLSYFITVSSTQGDFSGSWTSVSPDLSSVIVGNSAFSGCLDEDNDSYYGSFGCGTLVDCNDGNTQVYPGAKDSICNGVDNNCDDNIDEDYVTAATTCGGGECMGAGSLICQEGVLVDTCETPSGVPESCSDETGYDGIDNDCSGEADLDCDSYCDKDDDNYAPHLICLLGGYSIGDCDDNDGSRSPGKDEIFCNDVDENCNADDDDGTDRDGDGYKVEGFLCGLVDCDDDNNETYPGATDLCDGVNNDCNGGVDEDHVEFETVCGAGECRESTGRLKCLHGVETNTCDPYKGRVEESCDDETGYDGLDNNCDDIVDLNCGSCDVDGDGYASGLGCLFQGYSIGDCDDNDASRSPGKEEIYCNNIDENCNTDDDDGTDEDKDGYKIEGGLCGLVDCSGDDKEINPGATDLCDGLDNNCNGDVDDDENDLDGDGVGDSCDKCSNTIVSTGKNINERGCALPKSSKFDKDLTTDFLQVDDIKNVSDLKIGIINNGSIFFVNKTIDLEGIDLDANIEIKAKSIFVNTSSLPIFNLSAILHFYDVHYIAPKLLFDGVLCTSCNQISYVGGNLTYKVPHFSTYSVEEGYVAPVIGSGGGAGGAGGVSVGDPTGCVPDWDCADWTVCDDGEKTRTCVDLNDCGVQTNVPNELEDCSCGELWTCEDWTGCKDEKNTRVCSEINGCGTENDKPVMEETCGRTRVQRVVYTLIVMALLIAMVVVVLVAKKKLR